MSLSKPAAVEECAANGTCSDNPNHRPDAGADTKRDGDGDGNGLADGVTPDTADGPADGSLAPDQASSPDEAADGLGERDTRDGGDAPVDVAEVLPSDDRPSDPQPPDAGLEPGPEPRIEPGPEPGPEPAQEPSPEPAPEPAPEPSRDGGSGNCIGQLITDGYAHGTVPACSACNDNGTPLETKCKSMIDCLQPPSTKADMTTCLNKVGGSQVLFSCVNALTSAACPSGF